MTTFQRSTTFASSSEIINNSQNLKCEENSHLYNSDNEEELQSKYFTSEKEEIFQEKNFRKTYDMITSDVSLPFQSTKSCLPNLKTSNKSLVNKIDEINEEDHTDDESNQEQNDSDKYFFEEALVTIYELFFNEE